MFSSFFSATAVDPTAQNLHPVSSAFADDQLLGELEPKDTEWLCPSGFSTETQVYYIAADDGTFIMCQVIHSAAGLWYPTIQFVFKLYDPKTKETIWKSVNVNNFVTPPPGLDKRSCKADEFSISFKPASGDKPDSYTINANLGAELQLNFELTRPSSVPGYKIGQGPKGGYSYFGPDTEKPEGYVVHRFWPYAQASGLTIRNGALKEYKGNGAFIHAIQGMRPNLIASAWNFANFQSSEHGGVSAIQMEFTTCDTHGPKGAGSGPVRVNTGSLVIGGKLIAVTAETNLAKEKPADDKSVISRATHLNTVLDPDTQYMKPNQILYEWQAKSVISDAPGDVKAKLEVDLGDVENPKGLIEKVDVLAEIPYVIKMAVNYVAGTKPYIYQFLNPTKLHVTGPDALAPGLSGGLEIDGVLFNEATFIS